LLFSKASVSVTFNEKLDATYNVVLKYYKKTLKENFLPFSKAFLIWIYQLLSFVVLVAINVQATHQRWIHFE